MLFMNKYLDLSFYWVVLLNKNYPKLELFSIHFNVFIILWIFRLTLPYLN